LIAAVVRGRDLLGVRLSVGPREDLTRLQVEYGMTLEDVGVLEGELQLLPVDA
jgi:hypothetical protein